MQNFSILLLHLQNPPSLPLLCNPPVNNWHFLTFISNWSYILNKDFRTISSLDPELEPQDQNALSKNTDFLVKSLENSKRYKKVLKKVLPQDFVK